jgi:hypothetical protein
MAVVGINYEEPKPSTYKAVELSLRSHDGRTSKEFKTGDFVKDWFDFLYYIIHSDITEKERLSYLSSVDHFIMDGAPFESAYLKFKEDDTPYLDYNYDMMNEGIEFFVPKGERPTWEEFKEKYKKYEEQEKN